MMEVPQQATNFLELSKHVQTGGPVCKHQYTVELYSSVDLLYTLGSMKMSFQISIQNFNWSFRGFSSIIACYHHKTWAAKESDCVKLSRSVDNWFCWSVEGKLLWKVSVMSMHLQKTLHSNVKNWRTKRKYCSPFSCIQILLQINALVMKTSGKNVFYLRLLKDDIWNDRILKFVQFGIYHKTPSACC